MSTVFQKGPHQADAVLRAFRYQIDQSLAAWLDLRDGEELWLEVSEDFTRASTEAIVDVQVKSSTAAELPGYSLRSPDVLTTIRRFWDRSRGGEDRKHQVLFLAHGRVAKEQGYEFPGGVGALTHWRTAAFAAETRALRTALMAMFSGEPLAAWLATEPDDHELRKKLLRRISWFFDAPDSRTLTDVIQDRVEALYVSKGLIVSAVGDGVRVLRDRVWETASQQNPDERRLSIADLHRAVEAAQPRIQLQAIAAAMGGWSANTAPRGVLVTEADIVLANISPRLGTVAGIVGDRSVDSLIWIHGGPGVGKSTLARLLARSFGGRWLSLDLRPIGEDPRASVAAWRELTLALREGPTVDGVIVDDLADATFAALSLRIASLVDSLSTRGGRVVLTSNFEPSPSRLAAVGVTTNGSLQAPYLSADEVRDLVAGPNGPAAEMIDAWGLTVNLASGGGHPLLAASKVASLRMRAWPVDALLEDFGPQSSEAIRLTRAEARRRLLDELPSPDARALLRRVASIFDRADEALVLKLGRAEPPINDLTDQMAMLRGTWLDVAPDRGIRVSPLINDVASEVEAESAQGYRRIAAEHWVSQGALNERTLPLAFWNAFFGKHELVLHRISEAIETLPPERLRAAAAMLSPMRFLRTDVALMDGSPATAVALRLLQFTIADAEDDKDLAARIAGRLFVELDTIDLTDLRALQTSIVTTRLFLAAVDLAPSLQLQYLLKLRSVLPRVRELTGISDAAIIGLSPELDVAGFWFATAANKLRSSARFVEMVEALDAITASDRDHFLDDFIRVLGSLSTFINGGWAGHQIRDDLDPSAVLADYDHVAEIVTRWTRPDVEIEVAVARSVILDEMCDDHAASVASIDRVEARLGPDNRLLRQKAKVLSHAGDSQAALDIILAIEDSVGDGSFDRSLALRDAGVWAHQGKRYADALRLFDKAQSAATETGFDHQALVVGLMVEKALAYWDLDDRENAIRQISEALDAVALIDPMENRQNERAHQFARAAIGDLWNRTDPFPKVRGLMVGQASALAEDQEPQGAKLAPLAQQWRILALVEADADVEVGVGPRSLTEADGLSTTPSIEMMISGAHYSRAIAATDLGGTVRGGVMVVARAARIAGAKILHEIPQLDAPELGSGIPTAELVDELASGAFREILAGIATDILIWRRFFTGQLVDNSFLDRLTRACATVPGMSKVAEPVIKAASGFYSVGPEAPNAVRAAAAISSRFDPAEDPRTRFGNDLALTIHVASSFARRRLEPLVVGQICAGWEQVLKDQRFALTSPSDHAGPMELAIEDARKTGLPGVARLLFAAAPAVAVRLSETTEAYLAKLAEPSATAANP